MTMPIDLRDHENYDRDTGRTNGIRMVNITVEITADIHMEVPYDEFHDESHLMNLVLKYFPKEDLVKELSRSKIEDVFEVHIEMIGGDV